MPARFGLTQRDRIQPREDNSSTINNSNSHNSQSVHSRSQGSISATHNRSPNRPADETDSAANSNPSVRFSRHSFDRPQGNSGEPSTTVSLRHKTIPEIDSTSSLLKVPSYMQPTKNKAADTLNAKTIPLISPDSNLIKPTAASKCKSQLNEPDTNNSGIGEAWGKMKLASSMNGLPNNNTMQGALTGRDRPTNAAKVAGQLEMSKLQPNRVNTVSVADLIALRKSHHGVVSPKKQTLVLGYPGFNPRLRDSKSFSVIEGSLMRPNRPLFSTQDIYPHIPNQNTEQTLFQKLSEAPKICSKKSLPVKVLYPRYYRLPKNEAFGLNEKPVYFLAPVKTGLPFDV